MPPMLHDLPCLLDMFSLDSRKIKTKIVPATPQNKGLYYHYPMEIKLYGFHIIPLL